MMITKECRFRMKGHILWCVEELRRLSTYYILRRVSGEKGSRKGLKGLYLVNGKKVGNQGNQENQENQETRFEPGKPGKGNSHL
jgi:hypothetical protein